MIHATFSTRPTRALGCDFESRPSAFWYGDKTTAQITAFGWKWVDEPEAHALMLRADGRFVGDDGRTVSAETAYRAFRLTLAGADLVFGHNIRRFDLPLFQAGLLRLGLPILPELRTTDTLKDYPKRHDMSASLENLAKMHGVSIDGDGKKHMSIIDWETSNKLLPDGVALARERVVSDVLLQEALRSKLLELGLLREPRTWRP